MLRESAYAYTIPEELVYPCLAGFSQRDPERRGYMNFLSIMIITRTGGDAMGLKMTNEVVICLIKTTFCFLMRQNGKYNRRRCFHLAFVESH